MKLILVMKREREKDDTLNLFQDVGGVGEGVRFNDYNFCSQRETKEWLRT